MKGREYRGQPGEYYLFPVLTVRSAWSLPLRLANTGIIGAGHELRASKRSLATRTDGLPWLFLSERQTITRQAAGPCKILPWPP
jgi:hypothetical protein